MMVESKLKAGVIFGDTENQEYVYMPGSEVGMAQPICVYESENECEDVNMHEALRLVRVRSLRPTCHPVLGDSSC
ncbi:hypothetical protein SAMN02910356_01506 [Selenomonas sp. GACV-9]|uniref:hypothetical protein n=1 Tax=Selenomonas sp. GACV-9 TaxID=3158782 RepID=UPI0008E1D732|nr:hypothetical protein SAMN02910356_01506 [Selenomonas ruminantium]